MPISSTRKSHSAWPSNPDLLPRFALRLSVALSGREASRPDRRNIRIVDEMHGAVGRKAGKVSGADNGDIAIDRQVAVSGAICDVRTT